jgi:hypothetical protein
MEELRARTILLKQLMAITHREYDSIVQELNRALSEDPMLASRACVWMFANSKIRDQQDAAVITLLGASIEFIDYRNAGSALFGLDFLKTRKTDGLRALDPYRLFRIREYMVENKLAPRRIKELTQKYLQFLVKQPKRFDKVCELNRRALKKAWIESHFTGDPEYGALKLKRARAILFENDPPPDSIAYAIKQAGQASTNQEKARICIEAGLSYTTISSIIPKTDPIANVALVEAMTPTEALNSVSWVESSGILNIPEVKALFLSKIKKAKKSTASAEHRKSSKAKTSAVQEAVKEAQNTAAREGKPIVRKTLVAVDISSSMGKAVETAAQFVNHIAPRLDIDDAMLVWFRESAGEIKTGSLEYSDVKQATRELRPAGGTSMTAAFQYAIASKFEPEQVVWITDGGENGHRSYAGIGSVGRLLAEYPDIHNVVLGIANSHGDYDANFAASIDGAEEFKYEGDYYIFDQVGNLLAGERRKTLVEEILEIELPEVVR